MAINFGLGGNGIDGLDALRYYGQAQVDSVTRDAQRNKQILQRQQALERPRIAGLVNSGDFSGAQRAAVATGDIDYAKAIGGLEASQREQLARETETIGRVALGLRGLPADQRMAQLEALRPQLNAAGISDHELVGVDVTDAGLDGYISLATTVKDQLEAHNKANEPYTLSRGQQRFAGDRVIAQNTQPPAPDYVFDPESGDWLLKPGTGAAAATVTPITATDSGTGPANASADQVWQNMIQIESGGRPGVLGPQTPYGQAQGMTQMLPATAQQMAQKLGVAWRPELMTGTTPEAAQYQQTLGRAYFDEGLQRYDGDPARAAMFYHGGPNEGIWGPKTRSYAARATGGQIAPTTPPQQAGSVPTRIPSGRGARRQQAPSGYQYQGEALRPIAGGPADPESAGELRKGEAELRKEFNQLPEVKDFKDVRNNYNQIKALGSKARATPQDDISLIYSFMKLLDPGSVVRETEYATAQNAAGVPERVRNAYNQVVDGVRLSPEQRRGMLGSATTVYTQRRDGYNATADRYRALGGEYGYNGDRIAPLFLTDEQIRQRRGSAGGSSRTRLMNKYGLE